MPELTIDNQRISVPDGSTLLHAAAALGIEIPTLCYRPELGPITSCMLCVVKVQGRDALAPACSTLATDGLVVLTDTDEVRDARRTALELLLSDHLGDCEAPCQSACPAHLDIPRMIRQIAAGDLAGAIRTVKADIALPAVLGRICHAPCEKACRRGLMPGTLSPQRTQSEEGQGNMSTAAGAAATCRCLPPSAPSAVSAVESAPDSPDGRDAPLAICLLKRFAADTDLAQPAPYAPPVAPDSGHRVAIVGAGPAGLAAALFLRQRGHAVTILDRCDRPGGALRTAIEPSRLPPSVLDAELATITALGVEFRMNVRVGSEVSLDDLRRDYDAVIVTVGAIREDADRLGLPPGRKGIATDPHTGQTAIPNVFAGGDAVTSARQCVRAVQDGKMLAASVDQYLHATQTPAVATGLPPNAPGLRPGGEFGHNHDGAIVKGLPRPFTVHLGRPHDEEWPLLAREGSASPRETPTSETEGFAPEQAARESARCLRCDCRKPAACRLRHYAQQYHARPARFRSERRTFQQAGAGGRVIYESGKCIDCGICVRICERAGEELGLAFQGRGFDVRVAVPFDGHIPDALHRTADDCIQACPTGALAYREGE